MTKKQPTKLDDAKQATRIASRVYRNLTGKRRHIVLDAMGTIGDVHKYSIGLTPANQPAATEEDGWSSKLSESLTPAEVKQYALGMEQGLTTVRHSMALVIPTMIQRFAHELGGVDLLSFNGNHWIATWRSIHPRYWTIDLHIHGDRAYVRLWWGRDEGFPNAALLSLGIENRAPYNDVWAHYPDRNHSLNHPCRYEWTHDQKGNTAFITYEFAKSGEPVPVIISVDPAQMVAWFHDVPRPTA